LETQPEDYPSSFDWLSFLKPNLPKLVTALIIPTIVALIVTGRPESALDLYDYLLKPMMGVWTGTEIDFVFNRFTLLWIPFYLAACVIVHLARKALKR
jgi:hypothetical protein